MIHFHVEAFWSATLRTSQCQGPNALQVGAWCSGRAGGEGKAGEESQHQGDSERTIHDKKSIPRPNIHLSW